eukprot:IDg22164t1
MSFSPYETKRGAHKNGKISVQTSIAIAFLRRYGELHGLPRGLISSDKQERRCLLSSYLKKDVYADYSAEWNSFCDAGNKGDHCGCRCLAHQLLIVMI